jgi:hypothetical protein
MIIKIIIIIIMIIISTIMTTANYYHFSKVEIPFELSKAFGNV